jgi:small-conductance mechanosensitive channel
MINDLVALIPNIVVALIVMVLFYLIGKLGHGVIRRFVRRYRHPPNVAIVLGRVMEWTVALIGILVGLVIVFPDFSASELFQILGLGGVAIGFAFRDIFENFIAGILLLLREPFRIGDQIVFQQYEGTVESVETRATTIRTYDARRVVIPNAHLFTGVVTVNTAYPARRVEYDLGIGYGDDVETARALILQALDPIEDILQEPPPEVLVVDLAPSTVQLRVRWWIAPAVRAEAIESRNNVLKVVKETLNAHGIDLPFPTQQVLFHDQTEVTDGNRALQREGWPAGPGGVPPADKIAEALRARGS